MKVYFLIAILSLSLSFYGAKINRLERNIYRVRNGENLKETWSDRHAVFALPLINTVCAFVMNQITEYFGFIFVFGAIFGGFIYYYFIIRNKEIILNNLIDNEDT